MGFFVASMGFPMYTLCVLRGALHFFDICNISYKKKKKEKNLMVSSTACTFVKKQIRPAK